VGLATSSASWGSSYIFLVKRGLKRRMHLPEIDKFAHLKSPLHSWDPRIKIISISVLILSIVLLQDLRVAFLGLALAIILVFLSKIPFSFVFVHLRWVLFFVLALFIIISLTVPGNLLVRLSFLSISREGFKLSLLISLRAISAALLIFPMIGTTRFNLTLKALQKIKIPDRIIQLLMFTYRYIFLFLDEEKRIFIGANSRGWVRKTNLSSLKTMGNLVGMLLVHSFERTERIRDAMVSRGYNGRLKILDEFTLSPKDFIKASLIIALALLLNLFRWMR
jgi:cobalt/nickel transport system permease protein